MVLDLGLQSFAQYLLGSFADCGPAQTDLASASAPFCTLDQEIFEKKRPFATVERATAGEARYFTICGRSGRGFNPDDFILRCTVWALKLSMPHRESESSSCVSAVYRHHVHSMVLRPVMASSSGCGTCCWWIISSTSGRSHLTVGTARTLSLSHSQWSCAHEQDGSKCKTFQGSHDDLLYDRRPPLRPQITLVV